MSTGDSVENQPLTPAHAGIVDLAGRDRDLDRFQAALVRLRNDPDEQRRVDAIVAAARNERGTSRVEDLERQGSYRSDTASTHGLAAGKTRCHWAATDPVLSGYHDHEWGVPPADLAGWFERLTLEVFQAGLSWRTVLAKRDGFRRAFQDFEPAAIAALTSTDVSRILRDPAIVRNRAKVLATIANAKTILDLDAHDGGFTKWVNGQPGDLAAQQRVYRQTFEFASPPVVEAFLQSVGRLPPPHEPGCWRGSNPTQAVRKSS